MIGFSHLRFRFAASVLVFSVVLLAGCSGSPRVEGTVTFDGQPVEGGTITFFQPGDSGKRTNASGQIEGGKYSVNFSENLGPGSYKVEIYWVKGEPARAGKDPDLTSEKKTARQQVIPAKYNGEGTTLSAEIKSGVTTLNYDLHSK